MFADGSSSLFHHYPSTGLLDVLNGSLEDGSPFLLGRLGHGTSQVLAPSPHRKMGVERTSSQGWLSEGLNEVNNIIYMICDTWHIVGAQETVRGMKNTPDALTPSGFGGSVGGRDVMFSTEVIP